MDPQAIMAGIEAGAKILTEGAEAADKVLTGHRTRKETMLNGKYTRATGVTNTVFTGFNTLIKCATEVSGIISAQRESKTNASKEYAEIEREQRKLVVKLEGDKIQFEADSKKLSASIEHQVQLDALASQNAQRAHDKEMRKLEADLQLREKEQANTHEEKMRELEKGEEDAHANAAKKMEEADSIRAANERYRQVTDFIMRRADAELNGIQLLLKQCYRIQQLELTRENNERLISNIQTLISTQSQVLISLQSQPLIAEN